MTRLPPAAIVRADGQSVFYCPAIIKTPAQTAFGDTRNSCPFSQSASLPSVGNKAVIVFVVRLLQRGGPSAIIGLVIAVSVNAIHRMLRAGAWPHIGIEVVEGFSPTGTYLNPSPAIIMIFRAVWVVASLIHRAPGVVFRRFNHAVLLSRFATATPATSDRINLAKKPRAYVGFRLPAFALTKPLRVVDGVLTHIAQYGQAAERAAGQVFPDALRNGYNLLSHVRTSNASMMRGLRGVTSALQSPLFYHNGEYEQQGQGPLT